MFTSALHFALSPAAPACRRIRSLLTDRTAREFEWARSRLRGVERYQERSFSIGRYDLLVPDAASFLSGYQEIFLNEIYRFEARSDAPCILDVGANIGLSSLYFKSLYAKAQITAIEADPRIFRYLQKNLQANAAGDVTIHNAAAWDVPGEVRFHSEGADAGRIAPDAEGISVPAINLADVFVDQKFDFIKIDIEGAETRVLPTIARLLRDADFVFVEYHSLPSQPQSLDKVIGTLTEAGFRLRIEAVAPLHHPLLNSALLNEFDAQMNIFGRRA